MNYQETLDYLYTRLPMFSRIGAAALKPDLKNTLLLCDLIGNPQQGMKTIHVAGTNGKGSVSHMLASVLQSAGYKTGLYTSPHLKDFRERIRVNGEMISEEQVIAFVETHKEDFEKIQPSFFEMTVALCFDHFSKQGVDIAIIETGLGGRLDSTNVIQPELSVITNIGWDHADLLGDSLEKIAFEKAGIIKLHTPVVIGEKVKETRHVFESVAGMNEAPMTIAEDKYSTRKQQSSFTGSSCDVYHQENLLYHDLYCCLGGIYQFKNILTTIAALDVMKTKGWNVSEAQLRNGFRDVISQTGLRGRWHFLSSGGPVIICDTGHNEHGIKLVVEQLKQQHYRRLHMVWGMVGDKDISKVLELLPTDAEYYFTQAKIPRAMDAEQLAFLANEKGLRGRVLPDVKEALKQAMDNASEHDLIFIGGSTFVVAEII